MSFVTNTLIETKKPALYYKKPKQKITHLNKHINLILHGTNAKNNTFGYTNKLTIARNQSKKITLG